jgi:H+-translocating NAD(P) transhydrogenase subunit beta
MCLTRCSRRWTSQPRFATTDVALVVGATSVVNPTARTSRGTPILEVGDVQQVVFLKRSMHPGSAGVENELLYDPKAVLLFGDAKDSLAKVGSGVKTF